MEQDRAWDWSETLKAFAHPTRLAILDKLREGTRCVTGMEGILPVSQVNISQHLTVPRNARLVDFAQDGAVRCHHASRPKLVEGAPAFLAADHPLVRKTRERIGREKGRARREPVGSRG